MPTDEIPINVCCCTCKHSRFEAFDLSVCRDCGSKHHIVRFANWKIGTHEVERMKRLHPDFAPQKFMDNYRKSIEKELNPQREPKKPQAEKETKQ